MAADKAEVAELEQRLRDAAKAQDPVAQAAVKLVRLTYEAAKESLVTATGDDMLRVQGAARAFDKLHTSLTKTPPATGWAPENQ